MNLSIISSRIKRPQRPKRLRLCRHRYKQTRSPLYTAVQLCTITFYTDKQLRIRMVGNVHFGLVHTAYRHSSKTRVVDVRYLSDNGFVPAVPGNNSFCRVGAESTEQIGSTPK